MNDDRDISNLPPADHEAVEIMGLMPLLRADLKISVQVYAGRTCYLIEDPISSRFSRVGIAEYTLISLLDGRTTIAEALGQTATIVGPNALTEHEAATLCKWLVDSQLATTEQSRGAERLLESTEKSRRQQVASRINPLFQRVPLFNPDRIVKQVSVSCSWLFSMPMLVVWLAVVVAGGYLLALDWAEFIGTSREILSPDNWLWLIVTYLGLRIVHEAGHALVCRRFGGAVREAGVMLILFAPLPYVDVTSSWRFDSKWRRIATAAAGMYVELIVAAVMAIIWSSTDDPLLQQHARNVIITASLVTVVFNLNPLMRFDGYYMLCDWLELPNLATHGRQSISYLFRRHALGMAVAQPNWPEGRATLVVGYGIAAWCWRIFICTALVIAAESMLWGAGVVLASVAVVQWLILPIARLRKLKGIAPRRVVASLTTVSCLATGFCLVPWYSNVNVPVVVDYESLREVRTPVAGFVEQVLVADGEVVTKGQLLAVLGNRELDWNIEELQIDVELSRTRARRFLQQQQIAALQVEQERQHSLETRLADMLEQRGHLQVRAPVDGVVAQPRLQSLRGTFLNSGERLLSLGSPGRLRLVAMVTQRDSAHFDGNELRDAQVHLWGSPTPWVAVRLDQVHPRASTRLVHPALGSAAGGPLAVRATEGEASGEQWELIRPRFMAEFRLIETNPKVVPGQTGVISTFAYRGRLGTVLYGTVADWLYEQRTIATEGIARQ